MPLNKIKATSLHTDAVTETMVTRYKTQMLSGDGSMTNLTLGAALNGPASFTIDPSGIGDNTGTVVIAGDLQVDGTTTTINSTTLTVDDKDIVLASGSADGTVANGAGISADLGTDGLATMLYTHSTTSWDFNKAVNVTGAVTATSLEIDTDTLVVDESNDRVGICFASPAAPLHINLGTDKNIQFSGGIGEIGSVPGFQATNDASSANTDFGIRATTIRFATGSDERVRITDTGVGIGQTNPGTSLHIKDAITNPNTLDSDITIPASSNSMMAGPITLNATVTVPSGSTWTIV